MHAITEIDRFVEAIRSGERRALAKAITLIESSRREDRPRVEALLQELQASTATSIRIGVTGFPGAGKSTLIETLGKQLIDNGKKVAVLAIDPTSPMSGGSILGDKTRMQNLANSELAFVRPSPSSGYLGGVARTTRESICVCEAAGYEYIFVETVGVGQSEIAVSKVVDRVMVVLLPNTGDDLQAIKMGLMEIGDLIVIHKADGDQESAAKNALAHIQQAVQLRSERRKHTEMLAASSITGSNISEIYKILNSWRQGLGDDISMRRRTLQATEWFRDELALTFLEQVQENEPYRSLYAQALSEVESGSSHPSAKASHLVRSLLAKIK